MPQPPSRAKVRDGLPVLDQIDADIDFLECRLRRPFDPYRATPLQQGIWFEQEADRLAPFLNSSAIVKLRGPVDDEALSLALADLSERHQLLGCSFEPDASGLLIAPAKRTFHACPAEVSTVSVAAARDQADYVLRAAAARPFDLRTGPPLRATIVRIGPNEVWFGISIHHISIDGAGFALVLDDLLMCYRSRKAGTPPPPPDCGDFTRSAAEQHAAATSANHAAAVGYWADFLERTDVGSFDGTVVRPPQGQRGPWRRGGSISLMLDTASLGANGSQSGRPPRIFPLIAAAFVEAVNLRGGHGVVRCAVSLRNRRPGHDETVVGCFANELFFGCPTDLGLTLQQRARHVATSLDDAFDHVSVTKADLARIARDAPGRQWDTAQVYISENNAPQGSFQQDDLEIEVVSLDNDSTLAPLHLEISAGEPKKLTLHWAQGCLEEEMAVRVLQRVRDRLTRETSPAVTVADPALDPGRDRQSRVNPATEDAASLPDTLLQGLYDHARRVPQSTALVDPNRTWSYTDLRDEVEALARSLVEHGVGPGDRVMVDGGREVGTVLAHLSVLRAGATCVPIEPIVSDATLESRAAWLGEPWLVSKRSSRSGKSLGTLSSWGRGREGTVLPPVTPDQDAYILFTSGTTGEPHAFALDHRGLCSRMCDRTETLAVSTSDVSVLSTPMSFDIALWELYGSLAAGSPLDVPGESIAGNPARLVEHLAGSSVTILHATPTKFRQLDAVLAATGHRLSLRCCVSAGEALDARLVQALRTRSAREIYNSCGPAEASIGVTLGRLVQTDLEEHPHVGRLVRGVDIRICDDAGQAVPNGQPGELWVSGLGVTTSYLKGASPERFVDLEGVRWFRTGDRFQVRPDHNLEMLGRTDQQVKVAGVRVNLVEVEVALRSHPDVLHASVLPRDDGSSLVAWLEARPGATVADSAVLELCRRRFHPAAVPTDVRWVDQMDRSTSEKLRRPPRARATTDSIKGAGAESVLLDEHLSHSQILVQVPRWRPCHVSSDASVRAVRNVGIIGSGRLADEVRALVEPSQADADSVLVVLDPSQMSGPDWLGHVDQLMSSIPPLLAGRADPVPCTLVSAGGDHVAMRSAGNARVAVAQYLVENLRSAAGASIDLPLDWSSDELGLALAWHRGRISSSRPVPPARARVSGASVTQLSYDEVNDLGRGGGRLSRQGTYVIVGGHGGIGVRLAEKLVRDLDARVVLVSRRGHVRGRGIASDRAAAILRDVAGDADRVYSARADAADVVAMRAIVDEIERRNGAVTGIFNLAGAPSPASSHDTVDASLRTSEAVWAKVLGADVIAQIAEERDIGCVVHFSSTAGLSAPAEGPFDPAYGAANRYLDSLATNGGNGAVSHVTLTWGAWAEDGVFARSEGEDLPAMSTSDALATLMRVLRSDVRHAVISTSAGSGAETGVDAPTGSKDVVESHPGPPAPAPALHNVVPASPPQDVGAAREDEDLPASEADEVTMSVKAAWTAALGLAILDQGANFFDLGGHSLMLMNIINDLSEKYDAFIPLGEVLIDPTVRNLADVVRRSR